MATKSRYKGVKECSNHRTELDTRTTAPIARYWNSYTMGTVIRDGDGWYVPHPGFTVTKKQKADKLEALRSKNAEPTSANGSKKTKGKSRKASVQRSGTNARQAGEVSRSTQRHASSRKEGVV